MTRICCQRVKVLPMPVPHFIGLVQDCSNSSANALELLQSFTKPSFHSNVWFNRAEMQFAIIGDWFLTFPVIPFAVNTWGVI